MKSRSKIICKIHVIIYFFHGRLRATCRKCIGFVKSMVHLRAPYFRYLISNNCFNLLRTHFYASEQCKEKHDFNELAYFILMYLNLLTFISWKIRNPSYLCQSCNPKEKKNACLTKLENHFNNQSSIILVTNDNVSTIVNLINSITHVYEI